MTAIPEIMTQRLIIGPFKPEHLKSFLSFMLDHESTKYLMFSPEQKTVEGATGLLEYIISSYSTKEPVQSLAITMEDGTYVGSCGFSPIEKDKVCECYYSINRAYRGNGYAVEATRALINHIFKNTPYSEVRAYTHPNNSFSGTVARKLGMEYMGEQLHPIFENTGVLYRLIRD
ncbi:MAG: GNAT family N-acetyltransferase [Allomuricauda sp.]